MEIAPLQVFLVGLGTGDKRLRVAHLNLKEYFLYLWPLMVDDQHHLKTKNSMFEICRFISKKIVDVTSLARYYFWKSTIHTILTPWRKILLVYLSIGFWKIWCSWAIVSPLTHQRIRIWMTVIDWMSLTRMIEWSTKCGWGNTNGIPISWKIKDMLVFNQVISCNKILGR